MWAHSIYAWIVDVQCIWNWTSEHSKQVRFLIQKQWVLKYCTKDYPYGFVFIIYILGFSYIYVSLNEWRPQGTCLILQALYFALLGCCTFLFLTNLFSVMFLSFNTYESVRFLLKVKYCKLNENNFVKAHTYRKTWWSS